MIATRQLSHRVAQLRINGMRKALILACSFATIATPALAVDQAKVAVLEAQMRADEQTAIQAIDKAEAAAKLVLQTKDRLCRRRAPSQASITNLLRNLKTAKVVSIDDRPPNVS
jgi:hypothetical protein